MPTDEEAIYARREEWVAIMNGGDVNRYLSLLTEDCVWLPPRLPAMPTKAAIGAWLKPFPPKPFMIGLRTHIVGI